ncbi:MAG: hypothetical protein ABI844_07000 [Saprospiraceae bacterium]
MIKSFILPFCLLWLQYYTIAQTDSIARPISPEQTQSDNDKIIAWLEELYEPGVTVTDDSLIISAEAERVIKDDVYRSLLYPKVYTWQQVTAFIKAQQLKQAFWFLINLYPVDSTSKSLVVKSVLAYHSLFKMDKAIMSAFNTYIFMDPEIGEIKDGHSEVSHPHIMEKKIQSVNEILYYINKYEEQSKKVETPKN